MNFENSNIIIDKDDEESDQSSVVSEEIEETDISEEESEDAEDAEDINITNQEPVQKKRGRKCKPKNENIEIEKIQKKRGRKPKIKEVDDNEKIPKKRGRKPKEKVYSVKELPKTFFEENKNETLILHLPIKMSDITNNNNNPLPNVKNEVNYSIYDEKMNNYKINEVNLLPTQFDLLDNDILNFNDINMNDLSKEIIVEINEHREIIYENKYDNKNTDEVNTDIKSNKIIKKNLKNIMYEFINANNDKTWPESTDIYCWWCCHQFKGMPCALPEYYKKDKFYVNGCFCSFNCTASYNFSKNDDDIWERYSLLNLMYKKLYNEKFVKINLAPPREILKIFGGYLSIEEFRENSLKNEKVFTVIKPPLISIISKIEENITNTSKNLKNSYPLTNEDILNKTNNTLKLKRSKPVTNPNSTLQSFMDLKII